MRKETFKELSDRDWLLIRGHNIIGSLQPVSQESFLFDTDTKNFKWTEYEFVPGLIKIINEIIDNSIDVAIKSNFKFASQISIEITDKKIIVEDDGYGIPVEQTQEGVWLPEMAWGRARAGTNFDNDNERVSAGMNGIGSFAAVVFSKKFTGVTDDGKNCLRVQFENNAETVTTTLFPTTNQGTKVSFYPDLEKFGLKEIDTLHQSLIFQRILNLSVLYPDIKFKFNKRLVKLDSKKFMSMFSDSFELIEEDNYLIGVFPNSNADFSYHTYLNSLWLEKGGNHIWFLSNKIVDEIRVKLIRKYKSIKPGDIKNKISLVVFFRNFPNAKFDGQTKEFLTNTQKDITTFLDFNEPETKKDWEKFTSKIVKNKEIIDPITDLYNAKMLIEEKKKIKDAVKKQDLPEKYWPAVNENKNLFLAEGDSAIGAITAEIGRDVNGFFPLKGVPLNIVKDRRKVSKNDELQQLASILEMDLTHTANDNLSYENIIISVDRDVDGSHICGILLGIFSTFVPKYLEKGRIFLLVTPLITAVKNSQVYFMFTMEEYRDFRAKNDPEGKKYIYDYKKGLGTMEEFEWAALFKQFTLDELLQPLHLVDSDNPEKELQELNDWLADNIDFRKDKIFKRISKFDINKV